MGNRLDQTLRGTSIPVAGLTAQTMISPAQTVTLPQPSSVPGSARLHAFDNLRAFAMLLGVGLHALIPFVTDPAAEAWPIRNPERHPIFDLIVGVIHSFRMQLFFLIAGFFARLLLDRRGPKEFLRNRGVRIAIPFLLGMVTLVPLVGWQIGYQGSTWPTIHLWFLQYLLLYYAVALGLAWLKRFMPQAGHSSRVSPLLVRSPRSLPLWVLLTFLLMWWWPVWDETNYGRGQSFWPHPAILTHYCLFFACGWMLHRHQAAVPSFRNSAGFNMVFAWVAIAIWAVGMKMEQFQPGSLSGWLKALSYLGGSAMSWFFSFALLGYFLRWFDRGSPVGRYLADASYWMYLAHLPLIIALQQWLIPMEFSLWTKALLINLIAFAVLFASYHLLVKPTMIGRILNGPRIGRIQSSA